MNMNFSNYSNVESGVVGSKVLKAKIVAEKELFKPNFINAIAKSIGME